MSIIAFVINNKMYVTKLSSAQKLLRKNDLESNGDLIFMGAIQW